MNSSKYFRVPKKKEPLQENEVYITTRQSPINFLRYAIFLFEKRNLPYIKFKASGSAISSLVNIAEILKKVIPEIHQINKIYTLKYEQEYEPKEKGLDHVKIVRNVPILEIDFYKVLPEEIGDPNKLYGYQPALSKEVFERVKININNLIKRKINEYNNNNKRIGIRGKNNIVYRAGFRGKLRGRFRGNRILRRGYSAGFRGRNYFRGNNKYEHGNTNYNNSKKDFKSYHQNKPFRPLTKKNFEQENTKKQNDEKN